MGNAGALWISSELRGLQDRNNIWKIATESLIFKKGTRVNGRVNTARFPIINYMHT